MNESKIVQFYTNQTIFLTGSTGFLGQLFVEKLLRTCPDLQKLYLLIRPKKEKNPNKRIEELFNGVHFEKMKQAQPNYMNKVCLVNGDLEENQLGLSLEDRKMLINKISCIIHCGATVRFDEKLRKAVKTNVLPVRDLIQMAKEMKNLKGFLYISTAYSNCIRKEKLIAEQIYEPLITVPKLFQLLDAVDDEFLDKISPILIGDYPNNYAFSKSIAENLLSTEYDNLPIGICRPSIVISSAREPVPGWTNNIYGPVGIVLAVALGVLHTMLINLKGVGDIIPIDIVINCSLAALWDVAQSKSKDIKIYNCVSSVEAPITWGQWHNYTFKYGADLPSTYFVWHKFIITFTSQWGYKIAAFWLHTVPAHIADFLAGCIGKRKRFVKDFKKIDRFTTVLSYFTLNQWNFDNKNVLNLWEKLDDGDRQLFPFTMKNFDWEEYVRNFLLGLRIYLIKDPLETLPESFKWAKKLKIIHYTVCCILGFLLFKFVMFFIGFFM